MNLRTFKIHAVPGLIVLGVLLFSGPLMAQDACVEMGGLAWDSWWKADSGGPGSLPAGVPDGDYVRCKACHGWDRLGTDGGYARRSRRESRPNAGYQDGDLTSRNISPFMGGHAQATAEMVFHQESGRDYADGTGSWVDLDEAHSAANKAAHSNGFTLGNQHPDLSPDGVNGADIVLSQEQADCLAAFINFADGDPSAYFSDINPSQNPVLYTIVDGADPAAGEAYYNANCMGCHGTPDDDQSATPAGAPEGGMLAYLAQDGKFSEFAHKARWGVPDEIMTRASMGNPSSQDIVNVMKYLQDLGGTGFAISGGLSGTWYDPSRDGEGFVIDVASDDSDDKGGGLVMVATYYTYLAGEQVWLIGSGPVVGNSVTMDVVITDGADFGSGFDPADVNRTPWGTLGFTFDTCGSGTANATPDASQTEFEAVSYGVIRLTSPDVECP